MTYIIPEGVSLESLQKQIDEINKRLDKISSLKQDLDHSTCTDGAVFLQKNSHIE